MNYSNYKEHTHDEMIDILDHFDPEAARYVRNRFGGENFNRDKDLSCCFAWISTPQGHEYWSDLNMKIARFRQMGHTIPPVIPDELFKL